MKTDLQLFKKVAIKSSTAAIKAGQSVLHDDPQHVSEGSEPGTPRESDKQKNSVTRSVVTNWAGHIVFILGGFILPRLISDHLGQERLGVWDFGWSTVAYLNLLTAGIASAVNRYVAKFRVASQWVEMSKAISCCAFIFTGSAITGAGVTILLVCLLPWMAPLAFLPYLEEMQTLLFCLGLSVSIDLFLPTYVGIISGSQRFDLLALVEAGCYFFLLVAVVLILLFGGGLSLLGAAILCMRIIEGGIKRMVARRLCPLLKLSPSLVTKQGLKTVFVFGGKTLMETLAKIALYQGNNMFIAYLLGPASLAIYARSMTLILHTNKLLFQFGRVFAPSASRLKASNDIISLHNLVLNSAQNGTFIALPLMLVLGILGENLLKVWMGPAYAGLSVLPILVIGHFFSQSQVGTFYILMGMNQHGKAGLTTFLCSILSLVGTYFLIKHFQLGLVGVSISTSLAVAIPYLTFIPFLASRTIGVSLYRYFTATIIKPMLLCAPTAFCLLAAKLWAGPNDYYILAAGFGTGGVTLIFMYWMWALPQEMKDFILKKMSI